VRVPVNPLKKYLQEKHISVHDFAIMAGVDVSKVYTTTEDKLRKMPPEFVLVVNDRDGWDTAQTFREAYLKRREALRKNLMKGKA
jgi:hypothetical protein